MSNFIEIEDTFCGRSYVRTDGQTEGWTFETGPFSREFSAFVIIGEL